LLASGETRTLRLWDLANEGIEVHCIREETGILDACAISPDGQDIAYGYGTEIKLIDAKTGKHKDKFPISGYARGLAYASDGRRFIALLDNSQIEVFEPGVLVNARILDNPDKLVTTLSFSPNGQYIATGDVRRNVRIWDATTGLSTGKAWKLDVAPDCLAWSHDGRRLSAGGHRGMHYTDGVRGRYDSWTRIPSLRHRLVYSEDISYVVVWDADSGSEVARITLEGVQVSAVALSADGDRLAVACDDHRVLVFDRDCHDDQMKRTIAIEHESVRTNALAFSQDGSMLACSFGYITESEAWVDVWHVGPRVRELRDQATLHAITTGEIVDMSYGLRIHRLQGLRFASAHLVFSHDGLRLAAGSRFEPAHLWSLQNGICLRRSRGPTDAPLMLLDPDVAPFEVTATHIGTTVRSTRTGSVVASSSLVARLPELAMTDASARIWAVSENDHLHLFAVEGTLHENSSEISLRND
jgi:WD40 repeat protein